MQDARDWHHKQVQMPLGLESNLVVELIADRRWDILLRSMISPYPTLGHRLRGDRNIGLEYFGCHLALSQKTRLLTLLCGLFRPSRNCGSFWFLDLRGNDGIFWFALGDPNGAVLIDFSSSIWFLHNLGSQVSQCCLHSFNVWCLLGRCKQWPWDWCWILHIQKWCWLFNSRLSRFEMNETLPMRLLWTWQRLDHRLLLLFGFKFLLDFGQLI